MAIRVKVIAFPHVGSIGDLRAIKEEQINKLMETIEARQGAILSISETVVDTAEEAATLVTLSYRVELDELRRRWA
jgi:hypothetical protein